MAKKNGNGIGSGWALIVVLLLVAWAVSLAVPRPKVVFHEGPQWIGENILVGIPVLCSLALFTAFMVYSWRSRFQRKLERLRAQRLRAERMQIRRQQELEQKRQTDELKRKLAEAKRQAAESRRGAKRQEADLRKQRAELQKQEMRAAIKGEERLKEQRLRSERLG